MTDGTETARKQISSVVTRKPVTKVVAKGNEDGRELRPQLFGLRADRE